MIKFKRYKLGKSLIIIGLLLITAIMMFYFLRYLSQLQSRRPNILIITIDALRPDHLGCYGYRRDTSPNIDTLSKEGILFRQAIAQASWTVPSVVSLLTSAYPFSHGVKKLGDYFPSQFISLPRILKTKGYVTGCITSLGAFDAIINMDNEFDLFHSVDTYHLLPSPHNLADNELLKIFEITGKVTNLIEKNRHKKFFFWVHFVDTHFPPLNPPQPYHDLFVNDRYAELKEYVHINKQLSGVNGLPPMLVRQNNGIADLNYYIAVYDGAIRYVDEQIGTILKYLKKVNLDKNTLVIVSADHGEGLGEHGLYFNHSHYLYDELIKVPLIIKYEGLIPKNEIIGNQVQHIDIAPTILDILAIKKPSTMEGKSLLPLIYKQEEPDKFAFSNFAELFSIRTPEWKLIYNEEKKESELYNSQKDPGELNNVAGLPQNESVFTKLKNELYDRMKKSRQKKETKNKTISGDLKRKLKNLGYLQ